MGLLADSYIFLSPNQISRQEQEPVQMDWEITDSINFSDFNRIENNMILVADYLRSITYPIPALATVTNRDKKWIYYVSEISRIEQNLDAMNSNSLTPPGYIPKKTWSVGVGFDFTDANRLENNIKLLHDYGALAYESFVYSGTISCGQGGEL